mmetsp:Transcript_15145/g.33410  ORF Transcript_15145/g.33410 Transcript_15145/m.33410 type:complete len:202 (+) Transcript_15145:258-863(+)
MPCCMRPYKRVVFLPIIRRERAAFSSASVTAWISGACTIPLGPLLPAVPACSSTSSSSASSSSACALACFCFLPALGVSLALRLFALVAPAASAASSSSSSSSSSTTSTASSSAAGKPLLTFCSFWISSLYLGTYPSFSSSTKGDKWGGSLAPGRYACAGSATPALMQSKIHCGCTYSRCKLTPCCGRSTTWCVTRGSVAL